MKSSIILTILLLMCSISRSAEITGRVIDSETGEPLPGASIKITSYHSPYFSYTPGKPFTKNNPVITVFGTSISDSSGNFSMNVSDSCLSDKVTFEIFKDEYNYYPQRVDSLLARGAYSLGDIRLEYLSVHWPISDSIRNLPVLREQKRDTIPYPSLAYRTIKPPCLPWHCLVRQFDMSGGEWILFCLLTNFTPLMLTYRYPDGSFENAIPTGLFWSYDIKIKPLKNGILLDPGNQKIASDYLKGVIKLSDLKRDSDKDGFPDLYEIYYCLDPKNPDTDGDGVDDLNDPLPGIAQKSTNRDTLEILMSIFDTTYYLNTFGQSQFGEVKTALPESVQAWVIPAVEQVPGYNKDHPEWFHDFDRFLLSLSPKQLRSLYPHLKRLAADTTNTRNGYNNYNVFPYLEALKNVRQDNLEQVRREIMKTNFAYFLMPVRLEGDALDVSLHVPCKNYMFIGKLPDDCQLNQSSIWSKFSVKILKYSGDAALVRLDTQWSGDEYLLVKRNGHWVKVWKRLIWIS